MSAGAAVTAVQVLADPENAPLLEVRSELNALIGELLDVARDRASMCDALVYAQAATPPEASGVRYAHGVQSVCDEAAAARVAGQRMAPERAARLRELLDASGVFTPAAADAVIQHVTADTPLAKALMDSVDDVLREAMQEVVQALIAYGGRLSMQPRFRLHANLLNLDGRMSRAGIMAALGSGDLVRVLQQTCYVFNEALTQIQRRGEKLSSQEIYELVEAGEDLPVDLDAIAATALPAWEARRAGMRR